MSTLYDKLRRYSESDHYGFHMPGHKRLGIPGEPAGKIRLPYEIDITEIEGFDDLHHAHGILKSAQERAAEVYRAEETHFLVNGSTAGILSAVCGVTEKGDTVLVARNCHKSVYHAIYLNELNPVYLYPGFEKKVCLNTEIRPQDVRDALERYPKVKAVVIVSPTYDGVVSDVAAIAEAVHEKGLPLIVDEAHGAHFGFHPVFPENANVQGADIVIHSVHKTLPSLTQTALLHMNGDRADRSRVRRYLDMLQTSSPSYVLMAGIDLCMEELQKHGQEMFGPYVRELLKVREKLSGLKCLELIRTECYDISKLIISAGSSGFTGQELYRELLSEHHLQMEMAAGGYVLAMTSVSDTKEGFERLTNALFRIDNKTGRNNKMRMEGIKLPPAETVYTIAEAERMSRAGREAGSRNGRENVAEAARESHAKAWGTVSVPWGSAAGYISAEYAYLYPPGCPLIVPGERITEETVRLLAWYKEQGFSVEGLKMERYIEVLA